MRRRRELCWREYNRLDMSVPLLLSQSPFLVRLMCEGWGRSRRIYLTSRSVFAEVRKHLRPLMAKLADGRQVYFRFYEPLVLRVFLPSCTSLETAEFFGPISRWLIESEEGNRRLQFIDTGSGMRSCPISLRAMPKSLGDGTIVTRMALVQCAARLRPRLGIRHPESPGDPEAIQA